MQKFTRALTREIEVSGERLAVTLSEQGLSVRPVGSRRPPHTMSWATWVCTCTREVEGQEPTAEEVGEAVKALKAGAKERKAEPAATAQAAPEGAAGLASSAQPTEHTAPPPSAGAAAPPTPTAAPQTGAAQAEPATSPPHRTVSGTPSHAGSAERATTPQVHGRNSVGPAASGAGSLADLLHRIDEWLGKHRPRFRQALLPGATAAECDALPAALGAPLPEELRAWLMWHNGQSADVMGAFEEGWNLMSTDQIAEAKKELDAGGHAGWQRSWIPFLDDGNGDYLCLDPGQPGAAVRECWRGNPEHAVVAPSLRAWVEHVLQGLEAGRYHEDPERGAFVRR